MIDSSEIANPFGNSKVTKIIFENSIWVLKNDNRRNQIIGALILTDYQVK